jgi:O-antigen/teichoic acid export membrane protein
MDKKLFTKNSFVGALQKFLVAILTFVTIPIFIKILGSELYGVFATVTTVGALNRWSNLGLSISLIKTLSQQGKCNDSNYAIAVTFSILFGMMFLISMLIIIFNKFIILNILNIPINYFDDIQLLLVILIISNSFLVIGTVFEAILTSQRLIYKTSFLQLVYSFLYWGLIIISLLIYPSLIYIGYSIFFATIIWFIILVYQAMKKWGKLNLEGLRLNFKKTFSKQFKYSSKIYTSSVLGFFFDPVAKILVSNFIGVTEVGFLDIALRIKRQIYELLQQALWPLFQFFSEINDIKLDKKVINNIEQKLFLLIIPISLSLYYCANPIVFYWIGENVNIISISLIVVTNVHLIFGITVHPNYFFLTARYPMKIIYMQIVMVSINILIILLFNKFFGYKVIFLSYFLSNVISFLMNLYYHKKYFNSLIFENIQQLLATIVSFIIPFGVGWLTNYFCENMGLKIIIIPITILLSSIFAFRIFKLITLDDINTYFENYKILKRISIKLFIPRNLN